MACKGRLIGMPAGGDSGLLGEGTDAGQGYNRMVNLRRKAEAELVRDKIIRFNLPGKHSVRVAFSRDICTLCIRACPFCQRVVT